MSLIFTLFRSFVFGACLVFGFFYGSRAQACLVAHIEGCKEGRSTQYFPLNVKKSMYIVIFSEPRIFALKGEKGVVLLPAWLCIA